MPKCCGYYLNSGIQGNINNQGTLLGGRVYANAHDFNNTTANSLMAGLDYLQLDATGDIKNTQGAEIFSLGSLSLSADQLLNESSTIEAGQDLAVDVDQLTNRKRAFATEERTTTTEVDSHSIDPYGKYISGTRSYTETETTRVVTENSPSAYLLSGRNLSIQGDVDNLYSVISAGGSLSHNGGSLNNQSAVTNRVITRSGEDRMKYRKKKCITFSVFGYCALDITVSRYDNFDYNYTHTTTDTLASATFSANKNLTGRVDEVNNVSRDLTNVEDQNLLPAPNTRQAQGQADPVELNAPTTDATEGLAIKSGSDVSWMPSDWEQKEAGFELPSSPLITVSETPDHHYLVETSPHLTNYKEFISSDYMVQRLEHNPAKTTKRLGDGFVEQRLIRDQILEQTGVQYLGDFTSQEDQYRQLMENAIKEVGRLELTPGIALTDRQIEELQKPLVWMVEETFATENGPETALVPRVYLGHSDDIQLRPDGSLIAAQNVHLEVDGDFQNQGSLLASEDLGIRTRDLTNTGEIQTGGNLFLETEKDLTNRDGLIKGDQVGLAVGKNLINETQSTQLDYKNAEGELTGSQTFMAPTAEISGNNLAIEVGQDLTALGSRFDAAKNMSIQVDGQMELGTTQSLNQRLNRTLREVDATHQVTELNAGEQLQLSAGESLESQAAQIKAGTDMLIQAKDITLTAAKNVSENFSYMDKGTSGKITTEIMQETVLGNLIQAGGNLVASSLGGDLVSTASEFLAKKGTLALQAKNNIQLKAAQQKAKEYTQKQTKSSGFFNKTTRTRTTSTQSSTAIGNSLSGGRVEVSAGQDLEITASEVVSGHGTSLMAGGNLTLEAGENKVTTSSDYQKKRSGVFSNGGLSITAGKQKTDTTSTTTQTQAQQSVVGSLKGDVNLQAGKKYQQVGSQVTALEGDINVQAEDISITEFQETFESEQQTKFKQSGLTVSLSSPVIDAYESAKQTYEAGETAKSDRMKALAAGAGLLGLGNNASDTVQAGKATATGDVANMGLNLTATVGSTKSSSESQQSAITARGSQLSAGKNINLVATGGGESSNILIQGSQVKSGENTTLVADHSIDLLAAQNTSQQTSDSKSSSYGIGVAAKIDSGGFSAGLHLAANGSRGDADGQSVTHTNSQISAGEQLYLQSGGDTRLLGAVAQAEQIAADIGGDLTLQSLQDTQAYDSESQSLGGSVTIGLGGSGSAHYSQSDVQANYASVNQQSGLQAGDGGFQLQVDGNTTLNGGVISSSDTAVENRNNNLETTRIHTQDIQNRSRYSAESIGVSTGGAGYGHDSDTEKSTTPAGISGIAGHTDVRTGDQETGLKNNFDAQEVESDIQAQQQITAEFGKNASKAVGDFADQQAKALRDKLRELDDPEQQQALLEKAQKWDEGGLYRVTAHAVVGGLSGDLDGALGSSTAALAAPALNDLSQDLPEGVDKAVSTGIAVGLGMATGHIQGGVTALNEDLNNRQLHPTEEQWIQENAEAFAKQEDISVDEAKERLSQQALVNVDYLWRAQLREGEDMAAEDFLTSNENTFTNDLGYQQKLFTAEGQQLLRPEMYADTADVSFYQNYVQPGVTRELNAGLREELWNSTQAGLGATLDLTQALSENPEAALDGLTSSLLGLPQSMKDSFVETGHALGESTAVVLNPELSGKLNELYGTDVGVHQGTLAGLRTTGAVLGSLGAGKTADALGDAGKEAAESVSKRLDQLAEQTGNQALIRSGGQLDSQGNPLLDMRDLTTEQKGMMGELLGPETVRQIVPEGEKLARMPSVGETGIDDLFSVNRPDVDYVVIEYKFVGNNKTPGSQRLGNTADGRQGAESWTLGSGRLDQAVGRENALIIGDAIKSGRVESWVVTTRPNGSTEVEVLDAAGRVKPMDTSSILRNLSAPLNGAQP
jgi:filamentous hemagglutinin